MKRLLNVAQRHSFFCVIMIVVCITTERAIALSPPQKAGKGRYAKQRTVKLTIGAKKNGYTCVHDGHDSFKFEAGNVVDLETKKTLEGKHKLEFRCTKDGLPILKDILFRNGNSNAVKTECLILITPRIIITEEE